MSEMTPSFLPQVDYTSRDYAAIRSDLIRLIPSFSSNWTNRDPSDFGMTLVELFSYMGDMLSFYIDRAANEGFLLTASQRESILQIAAMLNYRPAESAAARTTLTFTNESNTAATIPAGTQIATTTIVDGRSTQVVFETDSAATVPARASGVNGVATVTATQGITVENEILGTSNGSPNQVFKLSQSPVIGDSITILVNDVEYNFSSYLIENTLYDPSFTTVSDAEGNTYVVFGDGIGGRIPPNAATITATYRVGVGKTGNVPAGRLTFFLTNPASGVTVVNQVDATGGADAESTDSIRVNAPLSLRSQDRAVSLKDYGYMALRVVGVAKAIAEAETFTNVNLYVAPFGDSGLSGAGTSAVFDSLAARVLAFFQDKCAPNVTLTILPPVYVPVDISVSVTVLPQYKKDAVELRVLTALKEFLVFDNTYFAELITPQDILSLLRNIPGVDYALVDVLRRTSDGNATTFNNLSRTSNLMTLTTPTAHSIAAGSSVAVTSELGPSYSNVTGTFVVVSTTSTTITVVSIGADIPSTAVTSGSVSSQSTDPVQCGVNEIPTEGTIYIASEGGIE